MNDRSMLPLYCRYQNNTNKFQIITIDSVNVLERFLSPGMSVEFPAQLDDYVTIKDGCITSIFADRIPCRKLSTIATTAICDRTHHKPTTIAARP